MKCYTFIILEVLIDNLCVRERNVKLKSFLIYMK